MGVKGLRKLIKDNAPGAITEGVKLASLAGGVFVVDASLRIFKWTLVDGGADHGHIKGLAALTDCLRRACIKSFYVFDGAPPEEKAATVQARNALRETGRAKSPKSNIWGETRELLGLLGIDWVEAAGEADPLVAAYTRNDVVAVYALTDDLDALAFGARNVILDVNCAAKTATVINLAAVLAGLSLSQAEFIDLCILMGCDYTASTLAGVGPVGALRGIRKYGSIDALIEAEGKTYGDGFTYRAARGVFNAHCPLPRAVTAIDRGIPDTTALRQWLTAHGYENKRVREMMQRADEVRPTAADAARV